MPLPSTTIEVNEREVEVQFDRLPGGPDLFNGTLKIIAYDPLTDTYTLEATGEVGFSTRLVTINFDGVEYADLPLHTITPPSFYVTRVSPGILLHTILLD